MDSLCQCVVVSKASVSELQTENQCPTKVLSKAKQFAYDAVQERVQVLDPKAITAGEGIGQTLEDLGASTVPPTFDQDGLDDFRLYPQPS